MDILEKKLYTNITGNHICHKSSHIGNEVILEGFSVTGKNVKISGKVKIKKIPLYGIMWKFQEVII